MMDRRFYPPTILCNAHQPIDEIHLQLQEQGLTYPLIAKPDIGMRGLKVKLLKDDQALQQYQQESKVKFLLQQYVEMNQEVGIFYVRIPGESSGKITGIVRKEFLTLIGDGISTWEQLLLQNERFLLQLPVLQETYGKALKQVLGKHELLTLVPYGNHARGAKFIDDTHLNNPELEQTIDQLCKTMPEFYYGRLDIRYQDWVELCKGINFSVIEVNGAGSEPTHIYDPRHSIFFAWKEIMRHWSILHKIAVINKKGKGLSYLDIRTGLAMLKANKKHLALLTS